MIQQGACTIFKLNLASGVENFTALSPYTYKIALYTANADLGPSTTDYTTNGEVPSGGGVTVGTYDINTGVTTYVTIGGYETGGQPLTLLPVASDGTTAYFSFYPAVWESSSFTARGALIYNSTTGAAVCVLDFGSDKTATNTFTVTFPADTSNSAIIRIV